MNIKRDVGGWHVEERGRSSVIIKKNEIERKKEMKKKKKRKGRRKEKERKKKERRKERKKERKVHRQQISTVLNFVLFQQNIWIYSESFIQIYNDMRLHKEDKVIKLRTMIDTIILFFLNLDGKTRKLLTEDW